MPSLPFDWRLLPLAWLALLSLAEFCLMGLDKAWAKRAGHRRVPEARFFLLALLGGALGGILGMRAFRHKTRHWYFVWGMPLILLLHVVLALVFAYFSPII